MTTSMASIDVHDVSKWYGSVVAVNDVTFQVRPGITGLLGPNGRRDVAGCRYRTVNLGYDLGNPARRAAVDGNPITDSRQVLGDPTTDSSCRTGHQRPPMDLIVKNHGG